LFRVDSDYDCVGEIKVKNRGENRIDGEQVGDEIIDGIDVINSNVVFPAMHAVGLGIHSGLAVRPGNTAREVTDKKKLQVVTTGDNITF